MLPPLHNAVLHDQLHPVTSTAACSQLRKRLIPLVGDAIRFLFLFFNIYIYIYISYYYLLYISN